jgi:chemotaxis response regulator CheB
VGAATAPRVHRDDGRLEVVGDAENGREAIDVVELLRPVAVILDQDMPEMTGTRHSGTSYGSCRTSSS